MSKSLYGKLKGVRTISDTTITYNNKTGLWDAKFKVSFFSSENLVEWEETQLESVASGSSIEVAFKEGLETILASLSDEKIMNEKSGFIL